MTSSWGGRHFFYSFEIYSTWLEMMTATLILCVLKCLTNLPNITPNICIGRFYGIYTQWRTQTSYFVLREGDRKTKSSDYIYIHRDWYDKMIQIILSILRDIHVYWGYFDHCKVPFTCCGPQQYVLQVGCNLGVTWKDGLSGIYLAHLVCSVHTCWPNYTCFSYNVRLWVTCGTFGVE